MPNNRKCKCKSHPANAKWHGSTSGKYYHGCDCTTCSEAIKSYSRKIYQRDKSVPPVEYTKNCQACTNPFVTTKKLQRFCSAECRPSHYVAGVTKVKTLEIVRLVERRRILWEQQNGICALCNQPVEWEDAALDHDHSCCDMRTRRACGNCDRGVLHTSCNSMLGFAGDDIIKLSAGIDYLIKARGVNIDGPSLVTST